MTIDFYILENINKSFAKHFAKNENTIGLKILFKIQVGNYIIQKT